MPLIEWLPANGASRFGSRPNAFDAGSRGTGLCESDFSVFQDLRRLNPVSIPAASSYFYI